MAKNQSTFDAQNVDRSIGAILVDSGRLSPEDAERVLQFQKEIGIRFGEAGAVSLVAQGAIFRASGGVAVELVVTSLQIFGAEFYFQVFAQRAGQRKTRLTRLLLFVVDKTGCDLIAVPGVGAAGKQRPGFFQRTAIRYIGIGIVAL